MFSGDHSSAGGTIAGIKSAFPEKRLGVIWIDAHADLHTPYTSPSGNVHGMPLSTALAEDNREAEERVPEEETVQHWELLKNTGKVSPKIDYSDLVFVGLRSFEEQEANLIHKNHVKVFGVDEVRKHGGSHIAHESLQHLSDCDLIYVSFDVDSLDDSLSKGTGTPVADGLLPEEVKDYLMRISSDPRLCCLEVTEINPLLDSENRMADIAWDILQSTVNYLQIPVPTN